MAKPLVLISESLARPTVEWLSERCRVMEIGVDNAGFDEALSQAQGLIVRTYTIVDGSMLDRAPNLKVVGRAGVGLDNIDLQACADRSIRVVHTPHSNAMSVVEYTISMMMRALRPIHAITSALNDNDWHAARAAAITPGSVVGSQLGIIGLGYIGSRVAHAAHALGMNIVYNDLRTIPTDETSGAAPGTLETVLQTSRVVCIHVDGRVENRGVIGSAEFKMMRPDVVFINASRGFVVDPDAAAEFARTNPQSTLILDVHEPEPIVAQSPLLGLENVILTPHIAAATVQAKTAMSWVVKDIWAVLDGREPEYPGI